MNRRFGEWRLVKIGTLSGQAVWIRPVKKGAPFEVGTAVEYRTGRGYGDKWQPARIWQIGDGFRLFLEL